MVYVLLSAHPALLHAVACCITMSNVCVFASVEQPIWCGCGDVPLSWSSCKAWHGKPVS